MSLDPIVVYWSPIWDDQSGTNWNLLYHEPEQLYKHLNKNRANQEENDGSSIMGCPAAGNKFKQTYVYFNPTDSHISVDQNMDISYLSPTSIGGIVQRKPSFKNNIMLRYYLSWLFFTEEE